MIVELIRIGNSRGIRIPKPLIEQCGFGDKVRLRVHEDCLVIAADRPARHGWSEALQASGATVKDDLRLDLPGPNEFDQDEWKW